MADTIVSVSTAKAQWSRLLARVEGVECGERIVIARTGRPVAVLAPLTPQRRPRTPGLDRGKVVTHGDFDDPLPEFEEYT